VATTNLNAQDSVEAAFTADIAFFPSAPLPTISGSVPYVLYADVQDSNPANDKTTLTFNLANASTCRYQDSLSLVRLNAATGGANWRTKWNFNTPINTWAGVTLSTTTHLLSSNPVDNNTARFVIQ
jgi:hypothetical protein